MAFLLQLFEWCQVFKEITLGWGQLGAALSLVWSRWVPQKLNLREVWLMHWPKSLPEVVLEETHCCF